MQANHLRCKSFSPWIRHALAVVAIGAAGCSVADDFIRPGEETFKINLGGILNEFDTSLRLDGPNGRGTEVNLDDLGLKRRLTSFLGTATWRFASNHRLGLQTFQARRSAQKTVDSTIDIKDQVIPVGTNLSSESKVSFLIATYQYSFIKNEQMELAGMFGLYGANFKFKFGTSSPVVDVSASTTAPLPMIGLSFDYYLMPQWTVSVFGQGFKIKVNEVDGSAYNTGVSTDYMLTRNFGVGLGYSLFDTRVDVSKSDFSGRLSWRMNSLLAYAQLRF